MFHMLLLKQNIITKRRVNKKVPELDARDKNSKKYKVKTIWNGAVYANKSESGHLLDLYYLVVWKGYSEEENTQKQLLAVQYLKKLISSFHKNHLEKQTATSPSFILLRQ